MSARSWKERWWPTFCILTWLGDLAKVPQNGKGVPKHKRVLSCCTLFLEIIPTVGESSHGSHYSALYQYQYDKFNQKNTTYEWHGGRPCPVGRPHSHGLGLCYFYESFAWCLGGQLGKEVVKWEMPKQSGRAEYSSHHFQWCCWGALPLKLCSQLAQELEKLRARPADKL